MKVQQAAELYAPSNGLHSELDIDYMKKRQSDFIAGAKWYENKLIPVFSLLDSVTPQTTESECLNIATKIIEQLHKIRE